MNAKLSKQIRREAARLAEANPGANPERIYKRLKKMYAKAVQRGANHKQG